MKRWLAVGMGCAAVVVLTGWLVRYALGPGTASRVSVAETPGAADPTGLVRIWVDEDGVSHGLSPRAVRIRDQDGNLLLVPEESLTPEERVLRLKDLQRFTADVRAETVEVSPEAARPRTEVRRLDKLPRGESRHLTELPVGQAGVIAGFGF
jgi:hypothetical protein